MSIRIIQQRKVSRRQTSRRPSFAGRKIKYMQVDPQKLIRQANPRQEASLAPRHHFETLGLNEDLLKNILHKGYTDPTPIQDQIIPHVMAGRDVVGLAATGTGKTAAFLIPIIDKVIKSNNVEKALIITPTRELAMQIATEGSTFARNLRCHFTLVIGGASLGPQIQELKRLPQVVVGTPGRIKDLTERGSLNPSLYRTIVLDEVDRMLDMGFIHDIKEIVAKLPTNRASLFFSATMTKSAKVVAKEFLRNAVTVEIQTQSASANINQDIVKLNGKNKVEVLHELLIKPGFDRVLVFGRTKRGVEKLSKTLNDRGFQTASLHGNKSQHQRQKALAAFKNSQVKILLATDVAARGIDIDNITHVINYELPETYPDYIHRIGRTGRANVIGTALTFLD